MEVNFDNMDNPGDSKYGMTTEQMFEAFRILKSNGAKHFGIHEEGSAAPEGSGGAAAKESKRIKAEGSKDEAPQE